MINIKRPAITIVIGMVAGIIAGLYPKWGVATIAIVLLILLFQFIKNKRKTFFFLLKRKKTIQILFISLIISNLYFNFINQRFEKSYTKIPEKLNQNATVISEASETDYYYAYNVKIKNKKFILYVKKNSSPKLQYGMYINIEGTYSKPEEARNFKGFDYKEYLKTKKIYGSIKSQKVQVLKNMNVNIFLKCSNAIRNKIIKTTLELLPGDEGNLVTGILIGEKSDISEEITSNFSKASISHILAISGTHVSYIVIGITYILAKSKTPKRLSNIITMLMLFVFMFITGFTPSVVRASIMGIIMLFAKVIYRKSDTLNSIAVSLIIILTLNPFAINDVGLQLSYLGTIGIVILNKRVEKFLNKYMCNKISTMLSIAISAQIMVLPITLLKFNVITPWFFIANIIAVPLAGGIIFLGYITLLSTIIIQPVGIVLSKILKILVLILINIAKYTAKLPFSSIYTITPSVILIIEYYFVVLGIARNMKTKKVILLVLVTAMVCTAVNFYPKKFTVHLVDVGQR